MEIYKTTKIAFRLFLFLFISFTTFLQAQSYDRNFQDGKVYLKFKDSQPVNFTVNQDNSVDISTVPIISELAVSFKVSALSRPYFLNNDPKLLRTLLLEIEDYSQVDQVINNLRQQEVLEYAEKVPLDKIVYVPNDSLYNMYNGPQNWNWHLEQIMAEQAWNVTHGSAAIKVAIVDNAVWVDHPDLADKIIAQRDVYYSSGSANPPSTGDPSEWSHGTHVAGLAGAMSNNTLGVASIGFDVSLIAIKASPNNSPNSIVSGFAGIQWAANNGADIINMSWGSNQFSQTNQNVINSIYNMGIVLIAAAGNDNVTTPHYPSAYQNVISVASVNDDDLKSDFSNYSTTVDVSAPGGYAGAGPDGLLSTTFNSATYGYYDLMSGTSMASPVVSGLAGLILSVNPDLTPLQVEQILESTADDISALNPDYIGMLGAGRINAFRAVSNTPFEPTAEFDTPVKVILPGTSIDFSDLSTGLPSEYDWTFEGAVPATSNDTNPQNVLYNNEGIFDVTLSVTNVFGTSTVTVPDYIRVTDTPFPYIFMGIYDSLPCIAEVVALHDSSLYEPVSWEWSIEPASYAFVNGTSSISQNPEVVFLRQGHYNITLSATNSNGTASMLFKNAIHVQGVIPPYVLNMEDGTSGYFILSDTIKSQSNIDLRAAHNSTLGIHFHGDPVPVGWKGSPTAGTAEQAWGQNSAFHSKAHLCGVDARGFTNVKLAFDLRQTYSLGPRYSWFRVLVNGIPVADFEGNVNYNPTTAGDDPWRRVQFDLSQFTGAVFDISLQASTRFSDKTQGQGDNVFIDNIEIVNSIPVIPIENPSQGIQLYPNPSKGEVTIVTSGIDGVSQVEILNAMGEVVHKHLTTDSHQGKVINISSLSVGLYVVRVKNSKGEFSSKLIVSENL